MKRMGILLLLTACDGTSGTALSVSNGTSDAVQVYVAFGADSKITASDWTFCNGSGLNCNFSLAGSATKTMPNASDTYINATFAFAAAVGCGVTKAEIGINNPKWYDTLDVSLVDGYSNDVEIIYTPTGGKAVNLGPPLGKDGNEKVYGLFPYGCDICVERQNPPCGISTGKTGCKKGTQYDPDVPCQFQGATMGGGGDVEIKLLK